MNDVLVPAQEVEATRSTAPIDICWLEQTTTDVPADDQWLNAHEASRLTTMRFAKRRTDWRLGRWTAKGALAAYLHLPSDPRSLANIEIRSASSGAPEVFLFNRRAPLAISISHRAGSALCALAPNEANLGCDLETVEPRSDVFVGDYFTLGEQSFLEHSSLGDRTLVVALLWSAKESAFKALHTGLRASTHSAEVKLPALLPAGRERWHPFQISCIDDQIFCGWWRQAGDLVRTIVSASPSRAPTRQT